MNKLYFILIGFFMFVPLCAQSDPSHGICSPGCNYKGIYTADFRSSDTYVLKLNVGSLMGNLTYISVLPLDCVYWVHDGPNLCVTLKLTDLARHRLELLSIRRILMTVNTDTPVSWPEGLYEFYPMDCDVLF